MIPAKRTKVVAGHNAIGIKNDHVVVISSPPAQEIGNVAALSPNVIASVTVKNFAESLDGTAGLCPCDFLFDLGFRIAGIAQDIEIKLAQF